jgi:hypothetical protein
MGMSSDTFRCADFHRSGHPSLLKDDRQRVWCVQNSDLRVRWEQHSVDFIYRAPNNRGNEGVADGMKEVCLRPLPAILEFRCGTGQFTPRPRRGPEVRDQNQYLPLMATYAWSDHTFAPFQD